jgi:hypothetical protein
MFRLIIQGLSENMQRFADFMVMRGLLSLERGDTVMARSHFARALETYHSGEGLDFGGRPVAEHFAKLLRTAGLTSSRIPVKR